MAETANIAKMAESISKEIFEVFLWEQTGPKNQNWDCEDQTNHNKKKTHPADVVFTYREPYSTERTYIHCDLKSYNSTTITKNTIHNALESLSQQIACANKSEEWRKLFAYDNTPYSITGLLFIYNHDNNYDKEFNNHLHSLNYEKIVLPKGSKIVVLGPDDIDWLNSVAHDILVMRGKKDLPEERYCKFFYPQLIRKSNIQLNEAKAATLEMLTSPFILLEYNTNIDDNKPKTPNRNFVIFYRGKGENINEFYYIINYIRTCQLLNDAENITIKLLEPYKSAPTFFQQAVNIFCKKFDEYDTNSSLSKRIKSIKYDSINTVQKKFSTVEIGMD